MGKIKLTQGTIPYLYTTSPKLIYGSMPFVTAPLKVPDEAPVTPPPPPSNTISYINTVNSASISLFSGIPIANIAYINGISII